MELSWSTFVLEIVNFLVLVWILQRFFYRPVMGVITRRRAAIEQSIREAETLRVEAERLRQQYEGRLAEWDRERQEARAALEREIEAERARRLAELREALEQEREKARVAEERRRRHLQRAMESAALQLGARFATRLLEQAAGPEVQE
ncbi:MAG: F0F1 ATP synthase subunit B, partial [Gammaproteobacteria bacterium]